jgi:hypothetical protein
MFVVGLHADNADPSVVACVDRKVNKKSVRREVDVSVSLVSYAPTCEPMVRRCRNNLSEGSPFLMTADIGRGPGTADSARHAVQQRHLWSLVQRADTDRGSARSV